MRTAHFGNLAIVEHLIWLDSVEYELAPAHYILGSPSVIRTLCTEQTVRVGEMKLQATPYPLRVAGVEQFLALLSSPLRKLPLVLLAPYANGADNLVNAEALAQHLAGMAIIVSVKDNEATYDISDSLGRTLSCFDGGVRIYWPRFQDSDDPRRHPLYTGAKIEAAPPHATMSAIERSIFAISAFRYVPDPKISGLLLNADKAQRTQQLETNRAISGVNWEDVAIDLDLDLSKAKERIAELEGENRNLKDNQQVLFTTQPADESSTSVSPNEITVPHSAREAVDLANERCKHLIILDSAIKASDSSPFKRPADILDALETLDKVADKWAKRKHDEGNGGDLRQHVIAEGLGKRCSMHISETTRKMYGNSYKFSYGGKSQFFEPHITLGSGDPNSCASIHFILDEKAEKLVVGHVGRHLPNTKT